jgi:hypothetical protein
VSIIITRISSLGGFRHALQIPPENGSEIILDTLIAQALSIFAFGTGKFSAGYLILRLLPPTSHTIRWIVWIIALTSLAYNLLQVILTFVQCSPPASAWAFPPDPHASCWTASQKFADIYVGGGKSILNIDFEYV